MICFAASAWCKSSWFIHESNPENYDVNVIIFSKLMLSVIEKYTGQRVCKAAIQNNNCIFNVIKDIASFSRKCINCCVLMYAICKLLIQHNLIILCH